MKRVFCLPILFVFALSLFFAPAPLSAKERITSFDVEAEIGQDASLTVKERITVIAEGSEIKRGIIRSIPTDFTDTEGVRRRAPLELLSAKLDGNTTLVEVTRSGSDLNFRLGDPMFPGHMPSLKLYTAPRAAGFAARRTLLNATGNSGRGEKVSLGQTARKAFVKVANIEFYGRTGEKGRPRVLPTVQ